MNFIYEIYFLWYRNIVVDCFHISVRGSSSRPSTGSVLFTVLDNGDSFTNF